ncbi:hypothetical protein FOL47_006425 [Perkinsus chesapeaki]|uniref:Stress-response A/B barrel domain-containing protein n=1 Tax=Perkinsus chesapeaki TaxID=330153 RepID=A0A7J6LT46_PERCH|nr:hypothetical protein FOL47_006425 [Perkinsus chesapeaki]
MTGRSVQMLAALGALAIAVKKGITEEEIQRLMDSRERLRQIPVVRSIEAYRDLGLDPERNHDLMFLVTFDSIEDYKTYSAHPVHMEVLKTILLPVLEPGKGIPRAILAQDKMYLSRQILLTIDLLKPQSCLIPMMLKLSLIILIPENEEENSIDVPRTLDDAFSLAPSLKQDLNNRDADACMSRGCAIIRLSFFSYNIETEERNVGTMGEKPRSFKKIDNAVIASGSGALDEAIFEARHGGLFVYPVLLKEFEDVMAINARLLPRKPI